MVAADPALQSRGLDYRVLTAGEEPALAPGHHLAAIAERASGTRLAFYDRPTRCHIRGLHYTDPDEATRAEDEPATADLLNPAAVACFIRLVYDRFAEAFGEHFGTLIRGIFTDEPNEFGGKCRREKGRIRAGTTGILRGHRVNEAPPDVGPNSPWWDRYRPYADYRRRLCYVNTDAWHVCDVAVLADACYVPWQAARVLFTHQRDFNYLEARHLWEDAQVDGDGIRLAGMHYRALIVDGFATA